MQLKALIKAKDSGLITVLYSSCQMRLGLVCARSPGLALMPADTLSYPPQLKSRLSEPIVVSATKTSPVQVSCGAAISPVVPGTCGLHQLLLQRPCE